MKKDSDTDNDENIVPHEEINTESTNTEKQTVGNNVEKNRNKSVCKT